MSLRLVVLVSGSGTNLQALLDACASPEFGAEVVAVGADRDGIQGLTRATDAGIATFVHRVKDFGSREEWDDLSAQERAVKLTRAGAPALGVRLKVEQAEEGAGELLARSNVVLEGYWEQPEETERCLAGDWFHTGDGAQIGDDGYVTIQDRKKDVIITGGENVSSIEVEDVLFSHPAVAEVAVIGVPSEKWGETIKALVVLAEGEQAGEEELIAWCKERAAGYKAPTSVEFRDELARTATGKLQKFKLRKPYWEGLERGVN